MIPRQTTDTRHVHYKRLHQKKQNIQQMCLHAFISTFTGTRQTTGLNKLMWNSSTDNLIPLHGKTVTCSVNQW